MSAGMKTKHKRCWYCGRRLRGNKGVRVQIDTNYVDAHKCCAEDGRRGTEPFAFGMEF